MRIGLRTIKTAVACVMAMMIANFFHLSYATSAGVIAILSLENTKKDSLYTGIGRIVSLGLATVISYICFQLLGFNAVAFGIYLLIFIPFAVRLNVTEGIVVNSVLVTHYLLEESFGLHLIANEFLLMIIGVGSALVLNSHMPNREKVVRQEQQIVEELFRKVIWDLSKAFDHSDNQLLKQNCQKLMKTIRSAQNNAKLLSKDRYFAINPYFEEYFFMRASQLRILQDMIELQAKIVVDQTYLKNLQALLEETALRFHEENDGHQILNDLSELYSFYQNLHLPENRVEFENRARLFQFLQSFQNFIELKSEFAHANHFSNHTDE
ncbi:aromatic acid exporter family protein [Enterococcus camelliae]|uniref:Aromatic acid exporter family protein n=1 Tax=Enterococcus camelliae TaxID=453959 RepID=A0ABW5TJH9_9ENTE